MWVHRPVHELSRKREKAIFRIQWYSFNLMQRVNICFYIGCGGDDGAIDRESWRFGSRFFFFLNYPWEVFLADRSRSSHKPSNRDCGTISLAVAIVVHDVGLCQFTRCQCWGCCDTVVESVSAANSMLIGGGFNESVTVAWSGVHLAERGHLSLRIRPFFSFLFSPCHVGWSLLYPNDKEVYKLKTSSCT
jgi:hypothetical protein